MVVDHFISLDCMTSHLKYATSPFFSPKIQEICDFKIVKSISEWVKIGGPDRT